MSGFQLKFLDYRKTELGHMTHASFCVPGYKNSSLYQVTTITNHLEIITHFISSINDILLSWKYVKRKTELFAPLERLSRVI